MSTKLSGTLLQRLKTGGLEDDAQERAIENALIGRIADFLLELGKGFAFAGSQYKLKVSENAPHLSIAEVRGCFAAHHPLSYRKSVPVCDLMLGPLSYP